MSYETPRTDSPADKFPFREKVFVVVGGGRGIGRRYCIDLARLGARVVVVSPTASAERTAEEIRSAGGLAQAICADIRDGTAIISRTLEEAGRIDGLIINSGIVVDRSFQKMTLEDWESVISVNLTGAFICAKAVWPVMQAQGGGTILLTTSGAGMHGNFGQANYASAKAGIIGLSKTLALEGRKHAIRVNAIAPMATTDMTDSVFSEELKNNLTVEQVSAVALALVHPQATESGAVIETGGGWAAKLVWQRSQGLFLENGTPADFLASWGKVTDLTSGSDNPSTTADCLEAALNRGRRQTTQTS